MASQLPGARAAIADNQGLPTPEFYRFLLGLQRLSAGSATSADIAALQTQIAAIQAEIDGLPQSSGYPTLQVTAPLTSSGLLQNGFAKLALNQPGDSGAGALKGVTLDAWGRVTGTTDATITGTAGRVTVANGDAAAGVPTIDLATVSDTGGGSLLKFVRDAWGRITGTSTPTTTDLTEGSNLYFTVARVLATVLTGLSTATNAVITAADSVLVALGKLQAQISANVTALAGKLTAANNLSDVGNKAAALANLGALALPDPGYINGLQMAWVSATQVTISSGAAYIQSAGSILQVPATITVTFSGLAASTWYHLYLYNNAGTAAIEYSTTAPASPYNGTARAKAGDASRRYVGSVLTDAFGNINSFIHSLNAIYYTTSVDAAPFVVFKSTAATPTAVSCALVAPITSNVAICNIINNDVTHPAYIAGGPTVPSPSSYFVLVGSSTGGITTSADIALDGSQSFSIIQASGASAAIAIRLLGYLFLR